MNRSRPSQRDVQPSIRSAVKDAADEMRRRRRLVRGALLGLSGALVLLGLLVLDGAR